MDWDADRVSKLSLEAVHGLLTNAIRLGNASIVELCQVEILKRSPPKRSRAKSSSTRARDPVIGFHFVCDNERGVTRNSDGTFWSGTWVVSESSAENILRVGGYVALHRHRTEPSYMQGQVKAWNKAPREKRYGDQDAQTKYGIDFLVFPTAQPYEWVGDATGEKGYARDAENTDKS